MDDVFRRFFGFHHHHGPSDFWNDEDRNDEDDLPYEWSDQSHTFHDPMFRHIEKQMDAIMKNFGIINFGIGDLGEPEHQQTMRPRDDNLRDHMLKVPDSKADDYGGISPRNDAPHWNEFSAPFFRGFWSSRLPSSQDSLLEDLRKDADLDDAVTSEGINGLLPHTVPSPSTSFFKSVQVQTVIDENGKIEEHRVIRDGCGNEETIIRRRLGDQEHTVTTKRRQNGREEITEDFINIDEATANQFDRKWNQQPECPLTRKNPDNQISIIPGSGDPMYRGIFQKLFGDFFPGTES